MWPWCPESLKQRNFTSYWWCLINIIKISLVCKMESIITIHARGVFMTFPSFFVWIFTLFKYEVQNSQTCSVIPIWDTFAPWFLWGRFSSICHWIAQTYMSLLFEELLKANPLLNEVVCFFMKFRWDIFVFAIP